MKVLDLTGLPAADRVERGLRDLAAGKRSAEALWLSAASRNLRELGLEIPERNELDPEPELAFYELLRATTDDAYGRYNSMRRELDSFIVALSGRQRRHAIEDARSEAMPGDFTQ